MDRKDLRPVGGVEIQLLWWPGGLVLPSLLSWLAGVCRAPRKRRMVMDFRFSVKKGVLIQKQPNLESNCPAKEFLKKYPELADTVD
jgi:hypothetical protein